MGAASFRLLRAGALGVAWILLSHAGAVSGQEEPPSDATMAEKERLEIVRREIERLQASLQTAGREESGLLGELHRLDLELDLHRRQIQLLEAEMTGCRKEIARKTLQVEALRSRLGRERQLLAGRVRALYVSGPLPFERAVLVARDPAEMIDAYRLAYRLAEADGMRIANIQSDLSELRTSLGVLESQKARLASLRSQEVARRRELEEIRSDRLRLLSGVRREAEDRKEALREMMDTERDLHRLVQALTAGGAIRPEWKVGFERFRGLLPWPAPGKVLVPFGAQKSSRFDTLVPHPGIDLATPVGEPVRAVFDGIVAFSDWFKGFGNLVILDHGEGFMTVYAHASERLVAPGDRVSGGQVIARGGDTGSLDGPKLYFEIWRDGKPEDPVEWLIRK